MYFIFHPVLLILFITIQPCLSKDISAQTLSSSDLEYSNPHLDTEAVDTGKLLDVMNKIKIQKYRLVNEENRIRVGAVGPDLLQHIPEAVEVVPKRVFPKKGSKPIVLQNVPIINENLLFWMHVGATQELIRRVTSLSESISKQKDEIAKAFGEAAKLEKLFSETTDGDSELQIQILKAEADLQKVKFEAEIARAKEEEEHRQLKRDLEVSELEKNEELTSKRLEEEAAHARFLREQESRMKLETEVKIARSKREAEEVLSKHAQSRDLALLEVKEQLSVERAKDIAEARAAAERSNEDVHLRKLKAQAEQMRSKQIATINAIARHLAESIHNSCNHPKKVFLFISYCGLLATGLYSARELTKLGRTLVESVIGKPKLIRETSRKNIAQQLLSDILSLVSSIFCFIHREKEKDPFRDIVLEEDLKKRIVDLAKSSKRIRLNKAPQRHVLFHGPPGTGKTLVAKTLATSIGMDYALMCGGDIGPLGNEAVTQIHNLFHWAKFSRKGVLLFIDEAECFLGDRTKGTLSESAHNALNALLFQTGTERTDFMMVLATNKAEDLDPAILDRCDESLHFPLPNSACRRVQLCHYFDKFVKEGSKFTSNDFIARFFSRNNDCNLSIAKDVMSEDQVLDLTAKTNGFSGREIAKFMISVQGAVFSSKDMKLSSKMVDELVNIKVKEHEMKLHLKGGKGGKKNERDSLLLSYDESDSETSNEGLGYKSFEEQIKLDQWKSSRRGKL